MDIANTMAKMRPLNAITLDCRIHKAAAVDAVSNPKVLKKNKIEAERKGRLKGIERYLCELFGIKMQLKSFLILLHR